MAYVGSGTHSRAAADWRSSSRATKAVRQWVVSCPLVGRRGAGRSAPRCACCYHRCAPAGPVAPRGADQQQAVEPHAAKTPRSPDSPFQPAAHTPGRPRRSNASRCRPWVLSPQSRRWAQPGPTASAPRGAWRRNRLLRPSPPRCRPGRRGARRAGLQLLGSSASAASSSGHPAAIRVDRHETTRQGVASVKTPVFGAADETNTWMLHARPPGNRQAGRHFDDLADHHVPGKASIADVDGDAVSRAPARAQA